MKPFDFSEFLDTLATISTSGSTLGANGGYVRNPVELDTFYCSFMPMSASKSEFGGAPVINATHYALTEISEYQDILVENGDVITISTLKYEVISFDEVRTPFGDYLCIYLKLYNE